jgi:hypothetical protein
MTEAPKIEIVRRAYELWQKGRSARRQDWEFIHIQIISAIAAPLAVAVARSAKKDVSNRDAVATAR